MIEIDGSAKSGSGTILRMAVALSTIVGEPLHIYKIREKRTNPGLRPQHLEAVLTAAKLCKATVKGARVGSREIWFEPRKIVGGEVKAEIGTAGSIPMLIMTILPICIFAEKRVVVRISRGGTDVSHSPTINYIRYVFFPIIKRMGVKAAITVHKYGYYPKGMGEVTLEVEPTKKLKPIKFEEFGELESIRGISVCTFLKDRRVADRQAKAAKEVIKRKLGFDVNIHVVYDSSNPLQKGSSIVLWAETSSGALLGADSIGEIRKPSEVVGREAAETLVREVMSKATVDTHMADMLIPYMALAEGHSAYLVREITDHLDTNIWLAEKLLNVKFSVNRVNGLYRVERVD